jgi:hypothetical protein
MFMDTKGICFISWREATEVVVKREHILFDYFAKVFDKLFFLDVSNVFTTSLKRSGGSVSNTDVLPSKFEVIRPLNLSECKNFLSSHDMIAVHFFSEKWFDWWLYYYLKKYGIPLVYIQTTSTVVSFQFDDSQHKTVWTRCLTKWKESLPARFFRFMMSHGLVAKADTYFLSNRIKAEGKINDSRYNEVVLVNSHSYDDLLIKNHKISEDYIVFLDSMPPYHGDALRFGYGLIDRESYYKNLNRVFDVMESSLGKEAVICLHPKYEEENAARDFGKRKTFKYRTDEFLAKAELVLFHESSSVNSAIIYGKKIIQLTGSQFNDFIKHNCQCYQKLIPFATLDIYQCDEHQIKDAIKRVRLNRKEYDSFLSNYITASEQRGVYSCEQVANHISRKYGIPKKE